MRQATLGLFYFVKFTELAFIFTWTVLMISAGVWFIDKIAEQTTQNDKDIQCIVLVSVALFLAIWNLFYNNLFINLRFHCKVKCLTCGYVIFDFFNYLFCYCFLRKACRDRCFTPLTIVKWVIKIGVIGYTIHMVKEKNKDWEDEREDMVTTIDKSHLDMYLIVYLLQHPIFIVSRVPIFLIYSVLTCCCEKGADLGDDNKFEDRILSFDYIEY